MELRSIGIFQISRDGHLEPVGVYEYHPDADPWQAIANDPETREWESVRIDSANYLKATGPDGETFYYAEEP